MLRSRSPSALRVVPCVVCFSEFLTSHSRGKYCTRICARVGWRKSWREYGGRNRQAVRNKGRKHYEDHRESVITRTRAYQRTPAGKSAQRVTGQRQRKKNSVKVLARQMVAVALRMGILAKSPCRCGALNVQGHHRDYLKPLDVEWLCPPCHRAEHRKPLQGEKS